MTLTATRVHPANAAVSPAMEALAIRYARAWNARSVDTIMAMHAEDTAYQLNGGDVSWGRAQVRATFAGQLAAVPDLRFELTSLHAGEGHFVFECLITGTRGDGAPLALKAIDLITVRDGFVVSKHTYAAPAL